MRFGFCAAFFAVFGLGVGTAFAGDPPPDDPYGHHVDPNPESIQANLVNPYCLSCHHGPTPHAKLDLTDVALYADGHIHGYPGILISPGNPRGSMIMTVIRDHRPGHSMPPSTSGVPLVKDDQAQALEDWIASLPPPPRTMAATYHEVTLEDYNANAAACAADAAALGAKFVTATGATVTRTYCTPTWQGQPDQSLTIGYQADRAVSETDVTDAQDGGYDSPGSCAADVPAQLAAFKAATGVEPFLGYCTPYNILKIYSWKESLVQRYTFHASLSPIIAFPSFDPVIDDPAALAAALRKAAESKGMKVARSDVKTGYLRYADVYLYYYADKPDYRFGFASLPTYPSMDMCQSHLGAVKALFGKTGVEPLYQFCARETGDVDDITTLYTFGAQAPNPASGPLWEPVLDVPYVKADQGQYDSFAACQADQSRVEQDQQAASTRRVVGSLCTLPLDGRPMTMGDPWYVRTLVFFNSL